MLNGSVVIMPSYDNSLRQELLNLPPNLGDMRFEDDIWKCTAFLRSCGEDLSKITLHFNTCPEKYKELCKLYALVNIRSGLRIRSIKGSVQRIDTFFRFLENSSNSIELKLVNKAIINDFTTYLVNSLYTRATREQLYSQVYRFFRIMKGWDEIPTSTPIKRNNPFWISKEKRKISGRYIPNEVTEQLDIIFKDNRIPVHYRLIYWILRSIPSRITEVCSIKLDCLKPSFQGDDYWVLFIPMWKQNGGYKEPELRTIYIRYDGHGKFLIDLIREQFEITKRLQCDISKKSQGYLFTYERKTFDYQLYERNREISFWA